MEIIDLNGFAQGVAKFDDEKNQGKVAFVPHSLPGDHIKARLIEVQKRFNLVKEYELIQASQLRSENKHCQYAGTCPGCSLHSMKEKYYLELKKLVLNNLVREPLKGLNIPLISLDKTLVRNKIILHYNQKTHKLAYKNEDKSLFDIQICQIADNAINLKIKELEPKLFKIPHLDKVYLKALPNNEVILGLIVNKELKTLDLDLGNNVFWQLNYNPFNIQNIHWLKRDKYFYEEVNKQKILWEPEAFFQTNRQILNEIIKTLRQWITNKPYTWDLYCGIGTLLIAIEDLISKGFGAEINKKAIELAKINAPKLNFLKLNLPKDFHKLPKELPELIIVNPPRAGIGKQMLNLLLKTQVKDIVYMSCNPISLANDLKPLLQNNYLIKEIKAFDMFTYTNHFEILTLISKD